MLTNLSQEPPSMPIKSPAQPPQKPASRASIGCHTLVAALPLLFLQLLLRPVPRSAASHMPHIVGLLASDLEIHFFIEGEHGQVRHGVDVACAASASRCLGGGWAGDAGGVAGRLGEGGGRLARGRGDFVHVASTATAAVHVVVGEGSGVRLSDLVGHLDGVEFYCIRSKVMAVDVLVGAWQVMDVDGVRICTPMPLCF